MNSTLIILGSLFSFALIGCGQQPSTKEATVGLCQDLAMLQQELVSLASLTPESKVSELKAIRDRIQLSLDKVKRAESVLQDVRLDELKKAEENFKKTIDGISAKETLADASVQVRQAGAEVEAARAQATSAVQCP
ncbi:hypothetical protein [Chroococcus sp. FPU101]|uniref:hypothetical protein n=1 Tax=Chroococcus sp. FPU101 TaxID=1974212 RepID=UPI001A8E55D7|nr:hypothetical protein [Chroococcus sp. FPU101]